MLAAVVALVIVTAAMAVGGALARAAGTPLHRHRLVLSLDPVGARTAWAVVERPGSRPTESIQLTADGGVLGYLYVSADAGARWRRVLELRPLRRSGSLDTIDVTGQGGRLVVDETVLHPSGTEVLRSIDGGRHWTTVRPPDPHFLYDIDIVTPSVWRLALGHRRSPRRSHSARCRISSSRPRPTGGM